MAVKSAIFKKGTADNFNKILKKQKLEESDPKFAISDSLQEYQQQLEKSAGYQNQVKLDKANIRQDVINFVIDYTVGDLDQLKGMDFDEAKTQQKVTEKTIKEYEGLHKKGVLNDEEIVYIKETVGRTNAELKKVLGLSTRLSLSFRDFKKELKPLKLAQRFGMTRIPILGKKIERAIEADERAESKALGMKRQLRRKGQKAEFKSGGFNQADLASPKSSGGREDLAGRAATSGILGMGAKSTGDPEKDVEEERESDKQFDTSSGLLERILEESELTNELLGAEKKQGKSFLQKMATLALAIGGIGAAIGLAMTPLLAPLATMGASIANSVRSALGFPKTNVKGGNVKGGAPNAHMRSKTKTFKKPVKPPLLLTDQSKKNLKIKDSKVANVKNTKVVANAAKKGSALAKSAKFAGNAVRVGGKWLWPVAAVMGAFDAASGYANAGEILGKEEGDEVTTRDKASASFASFLSGVTIGLINQEKTAKWFAGKDHLNQDQIELTQSHSRANLYNKAWNHPMAKNDKSKLAKVEEMKLDNVEKLDIIYNGSKLPFNVNNQNNIDNTSKTTIIDNKTTSIKSENPDGLVSEFSQIK